MTGSINAISNSMSSMSISSASASGKLTDDTKKQLEALGIDTSSIKTESQGLSVLAQVKQAKSAQAAQNAQGAQHSQPAGPPAAMEALKTQAVALADKLGISVSSDAKIPDIMTAISSAITKLQGTAGTDAVKLEQVKSYEAQYATISSSLSSLESQKQSSQAQLSNSMSGMANYNKIFHNL